MRDETVDQPLAKRQLGNAPPFGEGVLAWVATKE